MENKCVDITLAMRTSPFRVSGTTLVPCKDILPARNSSMISCQNYKYKNLHIRIFEQNLSSFFLNRIFSLKILEYQFFPASISSMKF